MQLSRSRENMALRARTVNNIQAVSKLSSSDYRHPHVSGILRALKLAYPPAKLQPDKGKG
ncbi:hypothetical protein [Rhizobium leguminosarum]|uniref:hypothetical protein n=1 Tax=Rhizobium leguminosarum TaxID=384 RepID=UPI002E140455|nr:hypothetical protein U8Q02_41560 [Rhizobium leguminosarum]